MGIILGSMGEMASVLYRDVKSPEFFLDTRNFFSRDSTRIQADSCDKK